jgi:hypothetical protein
MVDEIQSHDILIIRHGFEETACGRDQRNFQCSCWQYAVVSGADQKAFQAGHAPARPRFCNYAGGPGLHRHEGQEPSQAGLPSFPERS